MRDVKLNQNEKRELLKFIDEYSKNITEDDIKEVRNKLNKKIKTVKKNKKTASFVKTMLDQIKKLSNVLDSPYISERKYNRVIASLHYFVWAWPAPFLCTSCYESISQLFSLS
jgi:FKBP-type peptidyl-prolyl cis-trans isomerase (trigger factor)